MTGKVTPKFTLYVCGRSIYNELIRIASLLFASCINSSEALHRASAVHSKQLEREDNL